MKILIVGIWGLILGFLVISTYFASRHSPKAAIVMLSHSSLIVVGDSDHDLGIVHIPDTAITVFVLRNSGKEPVIISSLHPSCGCTGVILDSDHIMPGSLAHIKAIFHSFGKSAGEFAKNISVVTNSQEIPSFKLHFHGELQMPPSPHNTGFMRLKGIFEGSCSACHAMKGAGEFGETLWKDDCTMCHTGGKRMPPSITASQMDVLSPQKFQAVCTDGIKGENMPAFGLSRGGPLTDRQIVSLKEFFCKITNHKS